MDKFDHDLTSRGQVSSKVRRTRLQVFYAAAHFGGDMIITNLVPKANTLNPARFTIFYNIL